MKEHGEAVEYELLTVGLHIDDLGTRALTWRDLKVVAKCAPPQGALHRSIDPKGWGWTVDTYLAAAEVDYLAVQVWQKSGGKARKPTPVARPSDVPRRRRSLTSEALQRSTDAS